MQMASSSSMTPTTDQGGGTAITAVHPDIIQTHILTRLDGPTLATAGSASTQLRELCTEEKLWTDICNTTWPSTTDPLVGNTISTFPAGYRSFFSDSFSTLDHHSRRSQPNQHLPTTSEFISAVDIYYQNKPVYSKMLVTETVNDCFLWSPFRIDVLQPKDSVPIPVKFEYDEDTCMSDLEQHMTLSWIVIDPTQKRAANVSSFRPVSVQRNWSTGDIRVRYATIVDGDCRGGSWEFMQCGVVVTCAGNEGEEFHVREVSLVVEDMDEMIVNGKESLVILQEAMKSGRRKKGKRAEEREMYEEYSVMKRKRREKNHRRERRSMDMVYIATTVSIFMAVWAFHLIM